ncbi:hypothetical protein ABPG75_011808 [Micractinium tetrahymenae]
MEVSVLTLNCWGLWLVSRQREERMVALAAFLRSETCTADVVLLQECWVEADVEALRQAGAEGRLPHSHHYSSGAIGSGLLLLSRFPIAEVAFHPYSARGDPAALLQGDFYAGKGVGWAALAMPAGLLSVFNTHLSANYGQRWQWGAPGLPPERRLPRDTLAGVRLLQMLELAAFVAARSAGAAGVLLGGDLNAAPDTLELAVLQGLLPQLRDAWAVAQPLLLGATANALESSYTTVGAGHRPARIDYLLTSGEPLAAELAMADTGRGFSYSDHLGVAAVLRFGGAGGNSSNGGGGQQAGSPVPSPGKASGAAGSKDGGAAGGRGSNRGKGTAAPVSPAQAAEQGWDDQQHGAQNGDQSGMDSLDHRQALFTQLMQRRPAPFQHAASTIEQTAWEMRRGRRQFVQLAAGLWAAGFGCLGALLARPWWQQCSDGAGASYAALLSGVGVGFGWAGVLLVGGLVGRGMEMRALQQAARQLRLAVGVCEAIA